MIKSFLILTFFTTLSFALIFDNPHDYEVENFSDRIYREACSNCHTFTTTSQENFSIDFTDTSFTDSSLICLACHDGVIAQNTTLTHTEFESEYKTLSNADLQAVILL
jgi:hypothetical protein